MNKTLIKNFAIDARVRLIQMAIDNAGLVGVTKDKITEAVQKGADFEIYKTAAGTDYTITGKKIKQRKNLAERINKIGFEQVMEETAYTWFNRIIAIRYMEVNDYLPTRVRVLSSETAGKKEPDIITMAPDNVDLNFSSSEKELIRDLKAKQKMDEAFQILFIKQCNELNKELPKLFEKTSGGALDYTELLFSLSFIQSDGVVARLLEIEEEDFKDQVQIIGWMYQYYNTELKDDTFAKLKKNVKITKERIPAATQLFTPDWIVRYMVENSLGRLYAQNQKTMDEKTVADSMGWKYYLPQAEQIEEVQKQLDAIKLEQQKNGAFNLETIKVLDPCMGSGHILVYAFDILIQMYKNAGYNERDAAQKIMQNNIFGLDIDDRAAQLAYFALMMKGRQYDRRFFERGVSPKVYAIQESNGISEISLEKAINASCNAEPTRHAELVSASLSTAKYIIQTFKDAKEYGSIINVEKRDYDSLKNNLTAWKENHEATFENVLVESDLDDLLPLIEIAKVMSEKYDVVVTNPPYMGHSGMSVKLSSFAKKRYPDSKNDLFSIFIEKGFLLLKQNGYLAYITMQGWMFLSSYTKLRKKLVDKHILSLLQIGFNSFPGMNSQIAHAASFIIQNNSLSNFIGQYFNLNTDKTTDDKELVFQQKLKNNDYFLVKPDTFKSLPNYNFAYWISKQLLNVFSNKKMEDYSTVTNGMFTCNNNLFLRIWSEIDITKFFKRCSSKIESCKEDKKWYPYNKGGDYRRWYGNHEFVINFAHFGEEVAKYRTENGQSSTFPGQDFYFKESLSWSFISTSSFAIRYYPEGFVFDIAGSSIFLNIKENQKYFLGLLSSSVVLNILNLLNPTINYQAGDVRSIPVIITNERVVKEKVSELVDKNINYSKTDWDSFETSWDFVKHPLLPVVSTSSTTELFKDASANSILISDCYAKWEKECSERFATLKSNEEELNRIFIEIYGLQEELTPDVAEKDVTVRRADLHREIKSLISYSVGCMFGRYSLYKEGLAYAGGVMSDTYHDFWPEGSAFTPDADNVIPVTDEAYFTDDIVTRFVEFVRQVYGESTLEENLRFIAESLPNKGDTPKEVIRSYFLNDFYKDHCKIYQKRPIYWMFDSGKENGFKALIYMHRYDNQTLARVRTDYLHKLQTMYEAALVQCKQIAENPATAARDKAIVIKRISKITKQLEETKLYDQALGHIASQYIDIDLDDGVNVNYEKFQGVQVAREGQKAIKIDLLAKRG
ncbi:MAG: BREX-1 system adenine-specific DNA-methyltransferase PglX [Treponema sp.]|nr:BREX-1 system adenine-specific DNA-methyltransferase PglX [Treponema sp.]